MKSGRGRKKAEKQGPAMVQVIQRRKRNDKNVTEAKFGFLEISAATREERTSRLKGNTGNRKDSEKAS